MVHDGQCEARSPGVDGWCQCATRAYLASCTPAERAEYDRYSRPTAVRAQSGPPLIPERTVSSQAAWERGRN